MEVSWQVLKPFLVSRSVSPQYLEIADNYWVYGIDGPFTLKCMIPKGTEDATDFETNFKSGGNKSLPNTAAPFAAKSLPCGKKLYERCIGITANLIQGANEIIFSIPFPWVKFDAIECIGGDTGDTVDLMIRDNFLGSYSGVPNKMLNQFGFAVNVAKDYYVKASNFEADIYQGMIIMLTYNSVSAKQIGVNFDLNEVK